MVFHGMVRMPEWVVSTAKLLVKSPASFCPETITGLPKSIWA